VLVHIRDVGLIPTDYVFCEIEVPESLINPWTLTGEEALAKIESPVLSREFGDAWYQRGSRQRLFRRREAPVQAVPSVIIPREMNYLISTEHPQFNELVWRAPQSFRFDPRLIGRITHP
jgi:hypothetical protein